MKHILIVLICTALAFAQTQVSVIGGGSTARRIFRGTTAPATCVVGDVFFDSDATAGQNIYGCTAANTWTLEGGASVANSVTSAAVIGDGKSVVGFGGARGVAASTLTGMIKETAGTPSAATAGVDYIATSPVIQCNGASGTDTYTCTGTISAYSEGEVYLFDPDVNNTGAASLNVNGVGAVSIKVLSGGSLADPANNLIDADAKYQLIYDGTYFVVVPMEAAGTPGGSENDIQVNVSGALAGRAVGTGLSMDGTTLGIDTSVVPRKAEAENIAGARTLSGVVTITGAAAKFDSSGAVGGTIPVQSGTTPPVACTANTEMFLDTDADAGSRLLRCNGAGNGWGGMDDAGTEVVQCNGASGNDTYTCTGTISAYSEVGVYLFDPDVNNTGAASLNINGVGAVDIKVLSGGSLADPADNFIDADSKYELVYDGTYFVVVPMDATPRQPLDAALTALAAGSDFVDFTGPASSAKTFTLPDADATISYTVASGTATLNTAEIASTACATVVTETATGTATTDIITWTPNADIVAVTGYAPVTTGGLAIYPYPSSNNVNFKVCNPTNAAITPGAVTLNWRVIR